MRRDASQYRRRKYGRQDRYEGRGWMGGRIRGGWMEGRKDTRSWDGWEEG